MDSGLPTLLASRQSLVLDGDPPDWILRELLGELPNLFPDMPFIGVLPTKEEWLRAGSPTVSTDLIVSKIPQ